MTKRGQQGEFAKPGKRGGEDAILDRIQRALGPRTLRGGAIGKWGEHRVHVAIGDDAAVWRPRAGYETVLTCDWFLQGTHFLPERHPPDSVGWKCLARAVSDIAAMGAEAQCFLLSLALPSSRTGDWLDQFLRGLKAASLKLKCPVAGGDMTRQEQILINVSVVGDCRRRHALLRGGARAGDAIFVTGRLGEAEYGLRLLSGGKGRVNSRDARLRKHLYPEPRIAIGSWLAERRLATAMMDLSDGLSTDLPRLCRASGVGARIEKSRLPVVRVASGDAKRFDAAELALHGGDDYELLFTVAQKNVARFPRQIGDISLTRIGEVTSARKIVLSSASGRSRQLETGGWDPFR